MKKLLGIACVVAVTAPLAFAQTNVLSQNAVGYVRVTVPGSGDLNLCRLDFLPLDPLVPNNVANVVGDQLPAGSSAFIWDSTLNGGVGGYVLVAKGARAGWPTTGAGAMEIDQGVAFWLKTPEADLTDYNVYLMGEVPGANNDSETKTIAGLQGLDAVGYPYPAAIAFGDTTLQTALPGGATVFFWDVDAQGYQFFSKGARAGWTAEALDFVIEPGTSFWVQNPGAAVDWTEVKPYVWP